MSEKKWHISGVDESFTREELEEHLGSWKPPLHYHLMWTWWDVTEFFGELSYYLRKLLRLIECHILNRHSRGSELIFIDCDFWNLNTTVAELMIQGIDKLLEWDHGYPGCFDDDGKEWREKILPAMKEGFEEYLKIKNMEYGIGLEEEAEEKVEKGLDLFKKYFWHLWD